MNFRRCNALTILFLCVFAEFNNGRRERLLTSRKGFLFYTNKSITGRSCAYDTPSNFLCCEDVIILYSKRTKKLCVNFVYQQNGLNIDITLNSAIIASKTITDYKPLKICTTVPGSIFSIVCANVLELNFFPRSITACLKLEITTKSQLWQLSYNCINILTELAMATSIGGNVTTSSQKPAKEQTTVAMTSPKQMSTMVTMKMSTTMKQTSKETPMTTVKK